MTQEEKAKAYDEALERAKPLYEQAKKDGSPIWATYENIFPELTESEEDKIRREIIDIVKSYRSNCVYEGTHRFDECLAWLEKQKEQKPYQEVLSDSENRMLDYHASLVRGEERKPFAHENDFVSKSKGYIENAAHNYAMNFGDKESELYIEISDAYKAGAYYAELRQQPAGWSEEDENMRWNIISIVGESKSVQAEEMMDWLKSLPERFVLQPKQEWSEDEKDKLSSIERLIVNANAHGNYLIGDKEAIELQHFIRSIVKPTTNPAEWSESDKRALNNAIVALSMYANGEIPYLLPSQLLEDVERLKSLRPQHHWKPSEEQMKALKDAIQGYNPCPEKEQLWDLYEYFLSLRK